MRDPASAWAHLGTRLRRYWWAAWAAVWVLVAAVPVAVAINVQPPSAPDPVALVAEGTDAATLSGVTASVVSVERSGSEVTVFLTFEGRDELGSFASMRGSAALTFADGTYVQLRGGEQEGRRVTLHFRGLPPGADGPLTLDLEHVGLGTRAPGVSTAADRTPIGRFRITIDRAPVSEQKSVRVVTDEQVQFGPGTLSVSEVIHEKGLTTIRGRIDGLSEAQASALVIAPAFLSNTKGEQLTFRDGFQDISAGEVRFELRFDGVPPGEAVALEVPFNVNDRPHQPEAAGSLASWSGTHASVNLVIPE